MTEVWLILAAIGLGAACGLFGGVFGVGGGVIAIPVLAMLYGLDQQSAQGTVLVMVVPNVLFGLWQYRRRFRIDLREAATLAATSAIAAYPVADLATGLDPHLLRLAFAGFLAGLSALVFYRTWRGRGGPTGRAPLAGGWLVVLGVAGGAVSGLFGVGGAFVATPALTGLFGKRQVDAQGLALALVCPAAITALTTYAGAGQVDWAVGAPLAVGGIAAIPVGVAVAHHLPERRLRLAFCVLLTLTAGLLALRG